VHLLLGHEGDQCCAAVAAGLAGRGRAFRVVVNPFEPPARLTWHLEGDSPTGSLEWDDAAPEPLDGVFVRSAGWLDQTGWTPGDLAYMQAEAQAATLAWLWSLDCPVVNRPSSAIWYRPRIPLLAWRRLLIDAGLPVSAAVISNDAAALRAFAGHDGAIYAPLTSEARFLVADDGEWRGITALQERTTISLAEPHGASRLACLVGNRIVWDGDPPERAATLEPAMRRFATAAGLALVECAVASGPEGIAVVAIDALPLIERYGDAPRAQIVAGILDLLTAGDDE
jgi:hypothetical protein